MIFNGLETKTWDSIVLGHDVAIMRKGDRPTRGGSVMSQKKGILGYTDAKTPPVADESSQMFTVELLCRQYNLLLLNTYYL